MSKNGVFKTKLKNGMTVILKEAHTTPVTTWWVWYRVGSRSERTGLTGASHWVEHMMFKGTKQFPAGLLDKAVSRDGGTWNAMTYIDWTTYFETMPADKIDLGLRLEADRMAHSLFPPKEVESERTVIISEREGSENEPMFQLSELVRKTAFTVHGYHHETIGDMADLHTMTRDDLYTHYRTYYAPNNAIAVVVGDFDAKKMLKRIKELYEGLPRGLPIQPFTRPEPPQKGERRVMVEGEDKTAYIEAAYHAPAATDPDFYPMVVLESILAGAGSFNAFGGGTSNKSSRLYKALVETELAAGVGGGLTASVDPYLFSIVATVRQGHTLAEVETALDAEMDRVLNEPVTEAELAKAIKQAKAMFAFSAESVTNLGFWYGFAEILDTYEWFENYLERLTQVTVADVHRVAQKYLTRSNRTVGWYQPK
ncbi:MAG: insulinase family protein [Chloroflexi bacterium]|nr:insulinase family protein [Chloroflexota bacterium]